MTRRRIQQLRTYLAGDGTPPVRREWLPINAKELSALLDMAEEILRQSEHRRPSGKVLTTLKEACKR